VACTTVAGSDDVTVTSVTPGVAAPINAGGASATLQALVTLAGTLEAPEPTATITRLPGAPAALPVQIDIVVGLPEGATLRFGYDARASTAPDSSKLSFPVIALADSALRLRALSQTSNPYSVTAGVAGPGGENAVPSVKLRADLPQPPPTFEVGVAASPAPQVSVLGAGVSTFDANVSTTVVRDAAIRTLFDTEFKGVVNQGALTVSGPTSLKWTGGGTTGKVGATVTTTTNGTQTERVQTTLTEVPTLAQFATSGGQIDYTGSGTLGSLKSKVQAKIGFGGGTFYLRHLQLKIEQLPSGTAIDLEPGENGVGVDVPPGKKLQLLELVGASTVPNGPGDVISISPGPPGAITNPTLEPIIFRYKDSFQGEKLVEISVRDLAGLRAQPSESGFSVKVAGAAGRQLVVDVDATDYDQMTVSSDAATPQKLAASIDSLPGILSIAAGVNGFGYSASQPVERLRVTRDDQRTEGARDFDVIANDLPTAITALPIASGGFRVNASGPIGVFAARVSSNSTLPMLGLGSQEDGLRILDTPDRYEVSVRATGLQKVSLATASGMLFSLQHSGGRDLRASVERRQGFEDLNATVTASKIPAKVDFETRGKGLQWEASAPLASMNAAISRKYGNGPGSTQVTRVAVSSLPSSLSLQVGQGASRLTTSGTIGTIRARTGGAEATTLPAVGNADVLENRTVITNPGITAVLRGLRSFSVVQDQLDGTAEIKVDTNKRLRTVLRNKTRTGSPNERSFEIDIANRPEKLRAAIAVDKGSTGGKKGPGKTKVVGKKFEWQASRAIKKLEFKIDGINLMKKWVFDEDASFRLEGLPRGIQFRLGKNISLNTSKPIGLLTGRIRSDRTEKLNLLHIPSSSDGVTIRRKFVKAAADSKGTAKQVQISSAGFRLRGLSSFRYNPTDTAISIRRDKDRDFHVRQEVSNSDDAITEFRNIEIKKVPARIDFSLKKGPVMRAKYKASAPIDQVIVDIRDLPRLNGGSGRTGIYLDMKDVPKKIDLCWHKGGRTCAPIQKQYDDLNGNIDWDILLTRDKIKLGSFSLDTDGSRNMKFDMEICQNGGRCSEKPGSQVATGIELHNVVIPKRLAFEAHFNKNSYQLGQVSAGKFRPLQGWLYLDTDNDTLSGEVEIARNGQQPVSRINLGIGEQRAQDFLYAFDMYSYLQLKTLRTTGGGSWKCDGNPYLELELSPLNVKLLKYLTGAILGAVCR